MCDELPPLPANDEIDDRALRIEDDLIDGLTDYVTSRLGTEGGCHGLRWSPNMPDDDRRQPWLVVDEQVERRAQRLGVGGMTWSRVTAEGYQHPDITGGDDRGADTDEPTGGA
jgi:hypothetical protein